MIAIPLLEPRLWLGRTGRDMLALAISVALVGLAVNALVTIAGTWQVAVMARETARALTGNAGWIVGGGSLSRGQWPWVATVLTLLLGGGLMATGAYGARTGAIILRGLFARQGSGVPRQ